MAESDATALLDGPAGVPTAQSRPRSELARRWTRFARNRIALASLIFVMVLVLAAVLAPVLAPYDPTDQDLLHRFEPSFADPRHPLGTDMLGRDVLSRLIVSLRTALTVGFGAELIALVLAIVVGMTAGYLGGRVDELLMAFTDVMYAFPSYLLTVILVVVMGRSTGAVIIAIAIGSWVGQARLARAQTLKIKNLPYVEAGRSMGAGGLTITLRYILPNALGPLLVATSFGIPAAVAAEAGLSILGLGVAPPTPSWGGMIIDGYHYVLGKPYLIVWPLLLFGLTLLAFTFVGDGLRDAFDTREANR
ncbi:ABC transporter permease [Microlunatus sp. Gsoil 973]|jgi:ABC-type dipeptide/oligopeptide/nickel transport system permease subunit|uniref:ABC transporter permease n=1 Tax=Microlunatus sp. Gsoil 973 TaxID=2672569 RepID=UPI0012B4C287|nr:ABC transporter permease [Microlunatus sp. Gsoil 973]QGN32978.1 ABC transporter permease subunit [Microlunatus sp. Gsoil 973]